MKMRTAALGAALLFSSVALAQEMELQVELMGPLGTKTSHKGDRVFARVLRPDALKGDTMEGSVTEVRSGGKLRGNSVLSFNFDTLQHAGQAVPINTQIRSFQNSQGQTDVDEEGRVIRKGGGNTGKALAGTGAGGLIGGLAGGIKGAAIGAGVGAAASIAAIEIACDAPEIRFGPGSKITVSAKTRSGPDLPSLAGSAPAPAPASSGAPTAPPAPATAPTSYAPAAPAAAPAPTTTGGTVQPNMVAIKAEFIPGEKVLFYDDFTDMAPDEAPPHWKVRGSSIELKEGGGIREATLSQSARMTPLLTGIPKNFTLETEVRYEKEYITTYWSFFSKGTDYTLRVSAETRGEAMRIRILTQAENLVDQEFPCNLAEPVKEALWVQDGRIRFFLNGQRVIDANHVELLPITGAELNNEVGRGTIGYRRVRIAESTPDFSRTIVSTGRFVSYGILFDTDSDRLKPESAGAIKSIVTGLQANPALTLRIEGHTDSSGDAAHNLDLSRRRAEAVKAVLVAQFQIDAGRLSTEGLGSEKPVAPNDTPQGRSQNRRVEFVKQ